MAEANRKPIDLTLTDSDMNMVMMMTAMVIMMSLVMNRFIAPVTQQLAAQSYIGINDPRWVYATHNLTYLDLINEKPYQSWMIAFIINQGPDPVDVAINYPAESFTIEVGGTRTINRSGAQERICVMFFKCEPGRRATVSITGEY